jgi:hypothetical protein
MTEAIIDEETRRARARRSEELARWLREAGRRRKPPRRLVAGESKHHPGATLMQGSAERRLKLNPAWLVRLSVFGLLAVSYLQYFYFDAMVQVYSVHSLIVFVLVNGHA